MDWPSVENQPDAHKNQRQHLLLVVEDDPTMREVIALLLEDSGYQVLEADSGDAALDVLQHHSPDLILSDAMMPNMDGYTFCRQVRANAAWTHIPFIFLTARGQRTDIRRGMELGADDYLVKPFEPEELITAVQARLTRSMSTQQAIQRATSDLRNAILRTLGHEFKTPLTSVVGYTELLEGSTEQTSDEEFQLFLHGLHAGAMRLTTLVEDFLLLSRLESGALADEIHYLPLRTDDPDRLVLHVLSQLQELAAERQVSLEAKLRTSGVSVAANAQYLQEIIQRLVDNALKFSRPDGGQVVLSTSQDGKFWQLDVADDGIGIREEALSWIFEAFRQVDREKMEQQGVGLGLAIVKGLTELFGGSVHVRSTPGQGSTFTVKLQLAVETN